MAAAPRKRGLLEGIKQLITRQQAPVDAISHLPQINRGRAAQTLPQTRQLMQNAQSATNAFNRQVRIARTPIAPVTAIKRADTALGGMVPPQIRSPLTMARQSALGPLSAAPRIMRDFRTGLSKTAQNMQFADSTGRIDPAKFQSAAMNFLDAPGSAVMGRIKNVSPKLTQGAIKATKDAQLDNIYKRMTQGEDAAHSLGVQFYGRFREVMDEIDKFGNKVNPRIKTEAVRLMRELNSQTSKLPKPPARLSAGFKARAVRGTDEAFGGVAGFERDEEGNIRFNPEKAALGVVGMAAVGRIKGVGASRAQRTGKPQPAGLPESPAASRTPYLPTIQNRPGAAAGRLEQTNIATGSQPPGVVKSSQGSLPPTVPPSSGIGKIGNDAAESAGKFSDKIHDLYAKTLDRFHPLTRTAQKAGQKSSMEEAIAGHYGAGSTATYHIDYELKPILQGVDANDLRAYTIAKRDLELAQRGVKGSDANEATAVLQRLQQKPGFQQVEQSAQKLYALQDKMVKEYLVDTGVISKEAYATMRSSNQAYVPFKRVMDTVDQAIGISSAPASVGKQNVVYGIKGSERKIHDPLESIIENIYKTVSLGKRQQVAQTIANLSKQLPDEIIPLRTAENVQQRIDLFTKAKELKPLQNKLGRLLNTRNKWARQLKSAVNNLNKQGLHLSLKQKARELPQQPVTQLQTKKYIKTAKATESVGEEFGIPYVDKYKLQTIPGELSNRETKDLVNGLINLPRSEIQAIKSKIATRENRLGAVLDEIADLSDNLSVIKGTRRELMDEAALLRDAQSRGKSTVSVFKDGIKEIYEVPVEIEEAAKALNEESLNTIVKILAAPTRVFRATATGVNPDFMFPNIARDLQSAFINAGVNPIDYVRGLAHYFKGDEVYQQWLKSGGQLSRISLDKPVIKRTVRELTSKGTTVSTPRQLFDLFDPRKIYHGLEKIGQASEQPTRIAAFERSLRKGSTPARAAYAAQESSVNFARRGSATQSINALYAFMNARAQGIDRLIRTAKKQPGTTATRIGLITMTPALSLYAYNRQFPEYFDERIVPQYEKDTNFILMAPWLGENRYIKITKGDIGRLANPIESFLTYADGQDTNMKQAITSTLASFLPGNNIGDVIPTALRPLVEAGANKNFFTGYDIVPEYKENFPKHKQDNSSTEPIYRQIGQVINQSPAHIQNLTRGYLTGFARMGESASRLFAPEQFKTDRNEQGDPINRVPVVRRFVGGEKKTEEEQLLSSEKSEASQKFRINDIKSGVRRGDLTPEEGQAAIDKILERTTTKTTKPPLFTNEAGAAESGSAYELDGRLYFTTETGESTSLALNKILEMPDGNNYERLTKRKEANTAVKQVLRSTMPDTQKDTLLKQLGISREDAEYFVVGSDTAELRAAFLTDALQGVPRDQYIETLAEYRRKVNGEQIATGTASGSLGLLEKQGLITKAERQYLESIDFDEKTKKLVGTKKKGGGKKAPKPKKPSMPKIKARKSKSRAVRIKRSSTKAPNIRTLVTREPKRPELRIKKYRITAQ